MSLGCEPTKLTDENFLTVRLFRLISQRLQIYQCTGKSLILLKYKLNSLSINEYLFK